MIEERRKHPPECLRQEEWGEIKAFVEGTKDYRQSLCSKLDDIRRENKERFDMLMSQMQREENKITAHMREVDERLTRHKAEATIEVGIVDGRLSSFKKDVHGKIVMGLCAVISFAVLWGGLTTMVAMNSQKWANLEPEHQELMQDVEVLKEKSYGYRGSVPKVS